MNQYVTGTVDAKERIELEKNSRYVTWLDFKMHFMEGDI